ncbi:MAG: BatD family protein [Rikenellaceae bacterium]
MNQLLRKVTFTIVALLVVSGVFADVTFKANVPLMVGEGEPFRVEFELNAKPKDDSFTAPSFEGFNLIAGPSVSTGTSIQVINGSMSKTVNYTYTYVLIAEKSGNFTIPAATVVVDKKRYSTDVMPIEVVREQQQQQRQQRQQQSDVDRATNRVTEDDLFLRMSLSESSVYKGEPVRATIKLYSRVNIVHNENLKMPTFNGFWAQDITDSRSQTSGRETYRGKVYDTHVIREYLLYPQQSGELTIDPTQIDITAQVVVQSSRNVDPFFGGGHEFYNVRRHLETEPRTINVKRLPAGEPASFSGAVGKFSIEMQPLASSTIKANSAATLKVRVSGHGNMTFVQAPKLELPNSFELYNVRTTESIQSDASGAVGYKEFEYPFIARAEGDYTIPAIEFSYFDSHSGAYNVVSTNPFSVTITPDDSGADVATVQRGSSRMNIEMLGSDIRFIKLGEAKFTRKRDPLILSGLYFAIVGALLVLFVVLYVFVKRALRNSKNLAHKRGKMANKMAIQRFKKAKGYMDSSSEHQFYEEVLRGLWGYMSDKLNIPVSALTKEYVREELTKRGCNSDLVQEFSAIITICDEAQYSPMASSQMNDVYGRSLQFVSNIESFVKRKK